MVSRIYVLYGRADRQTVRFWFCWFMNLDVDILMYMFFICFCFQNDLF